VMVGSGPSKIMMWEVYGLMLPARAKAAGGTSVASCKNLSGEKVSYFVTTAASLRSTSANIRITSSSPQASCCVAGSARMRATDFEIRAYSVCGC
jgi:hypothetical protein